VVKIKQQFSGFVHTVGAQAERPPLVLYFTELKTAISEGAECKFQSSLKGIGCITLLVMLQNVDFLASQFKTSSFGITITWGNWHQELVLL
jgi:hypothetical protein